MMNVDESVEYSLVLDNQENEPIENKISNKDIIDQYARLINVKKEIEKYIDEMKVEIIKLSKLNNSEMLIGNDSVLKVKITNSIKFPLAKNPLRKDLEDILKENGKWFDVSMLNAAKLSAQFRSDNWDPDLKEKISKYSHEEESVRISIAKR